MTLYVGPTQEATWARARQIAAETRRSLSQVVADALFAYVMDHDSMTGRLSDRDRELRLILLRGVGVIEQSLEPRSSATEPRTERARKRRTTKTSGGTGR